MFKSGLENVIFEIKRWKFVNVIITDNDNQKKLNTSKQIIKQNVINRIS